MLVVTDNGVQVSLNQTPNSNTKLRDGLLIAVLFAINAVLGFVLDIYPMAVTLGINFLIFALLIGLQVVRKRHQPTTILSGGSLFLSPKTFKHTSLGKTTQYRLTQYDTIQMQGDSLKICNAENKLLYQIQGFSEPKQLEIAQAVLQGKTIQTQGKAIKMQSN